MHHMFIDLMDACDSDRRGGLCNILIEFDVLVKVVRLIARQALHLQA